MDAVKEVSQEISNIIMHYCEDNFSVWLEMDGCDGGLKDTNLLRVRELLFALNSKYCMSLNQNFIAFVYGSNSRLNNRVLNLTL